MKLIISLLYYVGWPAVNSCVRTNCEKRYSLFWFRLVIASAKIHNFHR